MAFSLQLAFIAGLERACSEANRALDLVEIVAGRGKNV
jgi:hypothetical protein